MKPKAKPISMPPMVITLSRVEACWMVPKPESAITDDRRVVRPTYMVTAAIRKTVISRIGPFTDCLTASESAESMAASAGASGSFGTKATNRIRIGTARK